MSDILSSTVIEWVNALRLKPSQFNSVETSQNGNQVIKLPQIIKGEKHDSNSSIYSGSSQLQKLSNMNEVSPLSHTNNNSNNSFCHQNHSPKSPIKEKSQERKDYEVVPKRELIVRYLHFKPWSGSFNLKELKDNGYYYKFYKEGGFVKIIKGILEENGFKETESENWSIIWSCSSIPPEYYGQLLTYQKVNHFPRIKEITRKDLLSHNLLKMADRHGASNFAFFPITFILPKEQNYFLEFSQYNPGFMYIVKPSASSKGQGIFLTNNPEEVIKKQNGSMVVSRYIENPLLINGLKFDLRIYVLITSVNPLKIYIYEDGLVRFATAQYDPNSSNINLKQMHLTNYSVNKASENFIPNKDGQCETEGSKWSLSSFKDYLKLHNEVNYVPLFDKIEDLIVKTILSIEHQLFTAFQTYVPYRNNCFELLGFDVLIDSNYKPWLLEVNMSPSLNTDSPLDLKIKGNLLADALTVCGFVSNYHRYGIDPSPTYNQVKQSTDRQVNCQMARMNDWNKVKSRLSLEERFIIKDTEEEFKSEKEVFEQERQLLSKKLTRSKRSKSSSQNCSSQKHKFPLELSESIEIKKIHDGNILPQLAIRLRK